MTYSAIVAAVSFGDVLTAVTAVAALVAAVLVGIRGVEFVLDVVRGRAEKKADFEDWLSDIDNRNNGGD